MTYLNEKIKATKVSFNYSSYLSILAVLAMFLPVHPSMQSVIITLGIPSIAVAGSLVFLPVLYCFHQKFNRFEMFIFGNFIFFIAWIMFKSLTSAAFGELNNIKTMLSMFFLLLSIACSYVASKNSESAINIFALMGGVALLHLIYLLAGDGFNFQSLAFHSLSTNDGRQNYQSTAFYLGFIALFFVTNIFAKSSKIRSKIVSLCGVMIAISAMSLVGARAAVLAIVIVIFVLVIIAKTSLSFKILIYLIVSLLLTLIVINIDTLFDTFTIFQRFQSLGDGSDSSKRIFLFQSAINLWSESPIFGNGIGTFTHYIGESGLGWYPHNFILECLSEAGIIAIIPILIIFYIFIRKAVNFQNKTAYVYLYSLSLSIYAVVTYQFVGGILTMWITCFFVSFAIFSLNNEE